MRKIPSPEEIEAGKTPKGGFDWKTLRSWGVNCPPKQGWRRKLESQYKTSELLQLPLSVMSYQADGKLTVKIINRNGGVVCLMKKSAKDKIGVANKMVEILNNLK